MVKKGQENLNYSNILGFTLRKAGIMLRKKQDFGFFCDLGGRAAALISVESDNLSVDSVGYGSLNAPQYHGRESGNLNTPLMMLLWRRTSDVHVGPSAHLTEKY